MRAYELEPRLENISSVAPMSASLLLFDARHDLILKHDLQQDGQGEGEEPVLAHLQLENGTAFLPLLAADANLRAAAAASPDGGGGSGGGLHAVCGRSSDSCLLLRHLSAGSGTAVLLAKKRSLTFLSRYLQATARLAECLVGKEMNRLRPPREEAHLFRRQLEALSSPGASLFTLGCPSLRLSAGWSASPKVGFLRPKMEEADGQKGTSAFLFLSGHLSHVIPGKVGCPQLDSTALWNLSVLALLKEDRLVQVRLSFGGTVLPCMVRTVYDKEKDISVLHLLSPSTRERKMLSQAQALSDRANHLLHFLEEPTTKWNSSALVKMCRDLWESCQSFNEVSPQKLPLKVIRQTILSLFGKRAAFKPPPTEILRGVARDMETVYSEVECSTAEVASIRLEEFSSEVRGLLLGWVKLPKNPRSISLALSRSSTNAHNISLAMSSGGETVAWCLSNRSTGEFCFQGDQSSLLWRERVGPLRTMESRGRTVVGVRCRLKKECMSDGHQLQIEGFSWCEDKGGNLVRVNEDVRAVLSDDVEKVILCGEESATYKLSKHLPDSSIHYQLVCVTKV